MKLFGVVLLLAVGAILFLGLADLPPRGQPDAPAYVRVAEEYVKRAPRETKTPNVVTAVLADYRSYDTLGETTVVFVAAAATAFLLHKEQERE